MLDTSGLLALLHGGEPHHPFCDAVSFVLMRQRRITDALTTDRHFE